MKAIHLCDQKGWSLAAPLLDLISGLTATEEGSLSGDPSLVKFSPANLESSEMGECFSFVTPFHLQWSLCCCTPVLPFHHVDLSDCNSAF